MTDSDIQEFNRLVAKRKSMTTPLISGPTNSAKPKFIPGAAIAASKAALEARADLAAANKALAATKAKLAVAQANLANRAKVATVPPATKPAATTSKPSATSPRDQRRAAAKGTIADQSDSALRFVAGHRSATDADRSAAKAELQRRGWNISADGIFTQSTRKASR